MRKATKILLASAAAIAAGAVSSTAWAQTTCGVSGTTTASLGNYDPFAGTALTNIPATISLTRTTGSGGKKTQEAAFYFTMPAGSPAYTITAGGSNVLYAAPYTTAPNLTTAGPATPGVVYAWGTAADPDTITIPVVITVPAGLDLSAGGDLQFGIRYVCKGTGGLSSVTTPTMVNNALTVRVNVLNALQASYQGPALAFGQIGDVSTPTVLGAPGTYTRAGQIRVASTGPYSVAVATNDYQMTAPSASTINYQVSFLGQTLSNTNQAFTTQNCSRATVAGELIPISAQLLEGGQTKLPGNYSDTLSVTITPVATTTVGINCGVP